MNLRRHTRTLLTAAIASGVVITGQAAVAAWADSAAPQTPGVESTVIFPAPVITRGTRPVQTPPVVVTPTSIPTSAAPTITANPRPVQTPPVIVTPAPTTSGTTAPAVEAPVAKVCAP